VADTTMGQTVLMTQQDRDRASRRSRRLRYLSDGLCVACGRRHVTRGLTRCEECTAAMSTAAKLVRASIKLEVLGHYSSGTPACACCGECVIAFLTIDHVHGGGSRHRREVPGGSAGMYRWLKANNYPPGFQVLCANCNLGRLVNGGVCPHQGVTNV
jgi:hypothetical protein